MEPRPRRAPPTFDTVPAELAADAVGAAEWARVVPMLRVAGMIAAVERPALVALCQQWSRYLGAHGRGDAKDADRALAFCLRLWNELGLTPGSRSKLAALPPGGRVTPPGKWSDLIDITPR